MKPKNPFLGLYRDAWRRRLAALVGAGLIAAVAGCRHQSLAEERLAHRRDSMGAVLQRAAERESENPQRLSRAAAYIRDDVQRDGRALGGSLRAAGEYLERDLRRWRERQPAYYREAGRLLRGKPETIERTSIILFL